MTQKNNEEFLVEEWFRTLQFKNTSEEAVLNVQHTYGVFAQEFARHFARYGLSAAKFNTLSILKATKGEGMPLNEIGDRLIVSRPNITGIIDRLERDGLAYRDSAQSDRRKKVARITEKGLELLRQIKEAHYQTIEALAAGLDDDEKKYLISLLTKLRDGVKSRRKSQTKEKASDDAGS